LAPAYHRDLFDALGRCVLNVPAFDPSDAGANAIGDGVTGEGLPIPEDLIAASVLVPLVARATGLTVLLTQRTLHLEKHAGQVSFPGGHVEPDDFDYVATALRETEEETGLERRFVRVIGALDECRTGTGYRIVPVLGVVQPGFALAADAREVDAIFEVPLAYLFDPRNHRREGRHFRGQWREFYVMQYGDRRIWGATAAMLVNFYQRACAAAILPVLLNGNLTT
jgi:8-oxo-dGTP pyrophosphatase MutT (NUDIX family)